MILVKCDVCGKISKHAQEVRPTFGITTRTSGGAMRSLDICDECHADLLNFVYNKRREAEQKDESLRGDWG